MVHTADIEKAVKHSHFHTLWESDAPRSEFRKLCEKIRKQLGMEPLGMWFDLGWQFHTVLAPDYKHGRSEFVNLIQGLW